MSDVATCPRCDSSHHRVVFYDLRNWIRIGTELLVIALDLVLLSGRHRRGMPLHRRCRKCGMRFLGQRTIIRRLDECRMCGYSLIGNVSGCCPECGWELPCRYSVHRKEVDRPT